MISKEESEKLEISGVIYLCYDLLVPISSDRILATHGDNISLINTSGEMLCTYDMIIVPTIEDSSLIVDDINNGFETNALYIDEYLIIIHCGKYGLIDYDGNIVIEALYSNIKFNNEGSIEVLP